MMRLAAASSAATAYQNPATPWCSRGSAFDAPNFGTLAIWFIHTPSSAEELWMIRLEAIAAALRTECPGTD